MRTFINPAELDLKDENVISINRISKATTGGTMKIGTRKTEN